MSDNALREKVTRLFQTWYAEVTGMTNVNFVNDQQVENLISETVALIEADRRKSVEEAKVRAFDDGWEACEKREPVSIQAAIKFRQDQNNWTDSQMAAMLDLEKSHFSEFKHGKRGLPVNSIRKAYAIGIPASVLLADQLSRPSTNEGGGK